MLCKCGCGGLAPIAKRTNRLIGWIKGQPRCFIKGHHAQGVLNHNFNYGFNYHNNRGWQPRILPELNKWLSP